MIDIRKCSFSQDRELDQLVRLQNEVYKERGLLFSKDDFRFWYLENPEGQVISYNAFDQGRMVAHQAFVPEKMLVDGKVVRCLRSMAVVTLSNYRGRGIFSGLTNAAVEEAQHQGYAFIYAVTNGNSFPSFIKHCGFSFVTRLNVKMGPGGGARQDGEKTYKRYWTVESLKWRLSHGTYYRHKNQIFGKFKPGVNTYMGIQDTELLDGLNFTHGTAPLGITLYVGLGAKLSRTFFNIPKFIKHSPFNLVFRDLTGGQLPMMTPDNVFYQLIDYDVA